MVPTFENKKHHFEVFFSSDEMNKKDTHSLMTMRVAHGQHVALLYPRHRGDVVGGGGGGRRCLFATTTRRLVHGEQLRDLLGARVPDEELATERHRQVVRRRPVDQIQIEVVAQIGRVQYLVGHRLHLTHAAAGRATRSGEALLGSRDGRCGRATRGGERQPVAGPECSC